MRKVLGRTGLILGVVVSMNLTAAGLSGTTTTTMSNAGHCARWAGCSVVLSAAIVGAGVACSGASIASGGTLAPACVAAIIGGAGAGGHQLMDPTTFNNCIESSNACGNIIFVQPRPGQVSPPLPTGVCRDTAMGGICSASGGMLSGAQAIASACNGKYGPRQGTNDQAKMDAMACVRRCVQRTTDGIGCRATSTTWRPTTSTTVRPTTSTTWRPTTSTTWRPTTSTTWRP
jgi:hypothetical protein